LAGNWRLGKAKRPLGAYNGTQPLIKTPGEARRKIYIPAFTNLVKHWLQDEEVLGWVTKAHEHDGPVFLRVGSLGAYSNVTSHPSSVQF
jgi:hypothetical protein